MGSRCGLITGPFCQSPIFSWHGWNDAASPLNPPRYCTSVVYVFRTHSSSLYEQNRTRSQVGTVPVLEAVSVPGTEGAFEPIPMQGSHSSFPFCT